MEVKATAKFIRISPQKVRMVVDSLKGELVETGLSQLKFMPQKSARIIEKTMRSAVNNANVKEGVDVDSLKIKNIIVDQGPVLKRFRARARGRGTRILKRTSNVTVILSESIH